MKVKCIKLTPKNTYGKYDDITVGKVYEAFKDGDFLKMEDDKGDLWNYEAELFEEVKKDELKIGTKVCLSSGASWVPYEKYRVVLGIKDGLYKLGAKHVWSRNELKIYIEESEELRVDEGENEEDETYIMEFIKANNLNYFTGNVIKCMIKFNQTQDKQYLADSLKFIEMMV